MKDIFIDADIATNFPKPPTKGFEDFVNWLLYYDENDKNNCAHLVVSQKLILDYFGGCRHSSCQRSIASIYDRLNLENRLVKITMKEIQAFIDMHFSEKIWNELRCKRSNSNDPYHLALVFLSNRKMALTGDKLLRYDLENVRFKKFKSAIIVSDNPEDMNYK